MAEIFIFEQNLQHALRLQQLVLRTGDHRVDTFVNEQHVFMELERRQAKNQRFPDLLLADLDDPERQGREIVDFCHNHEGQGEMKLMIVSQGIGEREVMICKKLGVNQCENKDATDERLERSIRGLLERRAA